MPDKRILVRIWDQSLSCYEQHRGAFARISSGALYDAWKRGGKRQWEVSDLAEVSLPLSGSASAGWSLPAVGWVLDSYGVAIHSTYWHNNTANRPPAAGQCQPGDALDFRWSQPVMP
jgi:hypothetical protein